MKQDPVKAGAGSGIFNIIAGTAGHIDHGKTTLVEKLTGINPDRLPEEKERGMTIDLGFSRFQLGDGRRIGFIDVPGHERFIKNMVAGATGIDLVLLVVAADDGVMPQTREHLEIIRLLGIRHGIIVVTKIDRVDADMLELAIEDIREAVRGTALEAAPVAAVSSTTGEGIGRLKELIEEEAVKIQARSTSGVFRMPVQRVFSSRGFGTILTGVPVSGSARIGDTLEVLPGGIQGRIRGIQAYQAAADLAQAGQSSAINLSDIDYKEIRRGMVAAAPGYFKAGSMIEASFECSRSNPRPVRHLGEIRFHCGTAEALGRIHLLEGKEAPPGSTTFVQLRLAEAVAVAPGDPYVLRLHSPMITIGGGKVIGISEHRLKQGKPFIIDRLRSREQAVHSPRQRLLDALQSRGLDAVEEPVAARGSGLPPQEARRLFQELLDEGLVLASSRGGLFYLKAGFEEARKLARETARQFFSRFPLRLMMDRVALRQPFPGHEAYLDDLLKALEKEGELQVVRGDRLQWRFHTPILAAAEKRLRDLFLREFRAHPFDPPAIEDLAAAERSDPRTAQAIADLLEEEGELVKAAAGIFFHREAIEEARRVLRGRLEQAGAMTASEAKTLLGSSRRYIIPLLEHFDREGLTIRRGDLRELRSK